MMDDMTIFSAKTVDEAVTKALIQFEITSDRLDYEVVEKGSSGFLGFGSKPAVIRARKKAEPEEEISSEKKEISGKKFPEKVKKEEKARKEEKAPVKAAEKEEKKQAEPVKKSDAAISLEQTVREFLTQIFRSMDMEVTLDVNMDEKEKELSVNMEGNGMGVLIGKRGQTLDSLQYLVSLVANKNNEGYIRVKLDTENYRARRKETLETLARNIAYKVKRTKRPVSLEPMNPYERRIIHSTLQNDKYVLTRSEGEEPFRHVVICLKREGGKREKY